MPATSQRSANGNNGNTGATYFNEWRQNVNAELAESARLHKEAAVSFERFRAGWEEHDRRIKELETVTKNDVAQTISNAAATPDRLRANIAIAISALSALVYVVSLIGQHWK